eukprot:SAG31_NODE_123_length_23712_cov_41.426291_33_plen_31_part_00
MAEQSSGFEDAKAVVNISEQKTPDQLRQLI